MFQIHIKNTLQGELDNNGSGGLLIGLLLVIKNEKAF